jgi:hypothetical protein
MRKVGWNPLKGDILMPKMLNQYPSIKKFNLKLGTINDPNFGSCNSSALFLTVIQGLLPGLINKVLNKSPYKFKIEEFQFIVN